MIGHDPDSGGHRIAQDVAYRPHQVSAVIYALDAYVRAAEIRESRQPFFVLSDELPAAALLSSDDKVYVVAHQAERKYRHLIPYCTYRNAVHAVDIVSVAFENHILLQSVGTNMPMILHTAKLIKILICANTWYLVFYQSGKSDWIDPVSENMNNS